MKIPEKNRVNCLTVLNRKKYGVQYLVSILLMCATKTCHDGEKVVAVSDLVPCSSVLYFCMASLLTKF